MAVTINISGNVTTLVVNSGSATSIVANGDTVWEEPSGYPPYLTFSSASAFTLEQVINDTPWDGTIEYSTDHETWSTWSGTQISSAATNGTHYLYMRGTGNTVISSGDDTGLWVITGSGVSCDGDVRMLFDYADPENVVPGTGCLAYWFTQSDALVKAPDILFTTLPQKALFNAFNGCTALTASPIIAATDIGTSACFNALKGCTALATIPAFKFTNVGVNGLAGAFYGCSLIKLSETQTGEYQTPYRVPAEGTGTGGVQWSANMFAATGGTFTGTLAINTTYYTSNTVV